MKKTELKAIADRYKMEFLREEITNKGIGLSLVTEKDIPELDEMLNPKSPHEAVIATKQEAGGVNLYHVYCPSSWLDLWGWAE